jgi:hypothetical protein
MFQVSYSDLWNVPKLIHFQRLKGAIDARIAEEQERANIHPEPARTNIVQRSKSKKQGIARDKRDEVGSAKTTRTPEGSSAFVVDDDSPNTPEESLTGAESDYTDKMASADEANGQVARLEDLGKATTRDPNAKTNLVLPTDVAVKLRKLEKLENRYQGK